MFHPASPAGGRVGGAHDQAVAVHHSFPPNFTPAGDFVVDVVDTGFAPTENGPHPWLDNHIQPSENSAETIPSIRSTMLGPVDGHGTFVAGLIIREAPAARVYMTRIGSWDDVDVAAAITAAIGVDGRPRLLNLSFAGATSDQRRSVPAEIRSALQAMDERSVVVVAAGNDGSPEIHYPGGLTDLRARIITVGAVDETLTAPIGAPPSVAGFSNYGSWVDCYASGVQVLGPHCYFRETVDPEIPRVAQHFRGWALWSGSSFATATVTGRIARVAIDRGISLTDAADLVVGKADLIPVPHEDPRRDEPDWKYFVRGVASTWGEITLPAPKAEPSS